MLVGAFNKEKVLAGAFSGHCTFSRRIVDSSRGVSLVLDVDMRAAGDYDPAWGAWDEEEEQYNPDKYGIKLISHPMNYTDTQFDKELL